VLLADRTDPGYEIFARALSMTPSFSPLPVAEALAIVNWTDELKRRASQSNGR
jgi:hypothetical protein